jgi:hypothetical protein
LIYKIRNIIFQETNWHCSPHSCQFLRIMMSFAFCRRKHSTNGFFLIHLWIKLYASHCHPFNLGVHLEF